MPEICVLLCTWTSPASAEVAACVPLNRTDVAPLKLLPLSGHVVPRHAGAVGALPGASAVASGITGWEVKAPISVADSPAVVRTVTSHVTGTLPSKRPV